MKFRFWGVRGSIACPGPKTSYFGGNTSCVEVRCGDQIIVLDAGTGIRPLGLSLREEFQKQPLHVSLLISHTHWDHIQGLPFFGPAWVPGNELTILGFEGAQSGLESILSAQMQSPYFPVSMKEMRGTLITKEIWEQKFLIGDVVVRALPVNHPGSCMAYRLTHGNASLVYMPDFEPWVRITANKDELPDPRNAELSAFIEGADAFICDSQYLPEEYESHIGWGHSCVDDVVRLAARSKIQKTFLFHHDPEHSDDIVRQKLARAQWVLNDEGSTLSVEAAREGESWEIAE